PALKSRGFAPRIVVWRSVLCNGPGPSSLERDVGEGENPVEFGPCCSTRRCLRVGLFGNAALSGRKIPSKAKYRQETDSEQVPRGKDEKDFEKRVKKCLKLLGGKRMEAAGAPRLDAERLMLVRRSTRGAGQRGPSRRDKSGLCCPPMPLRWPRDEARAGFVRRALGHLRARDAGVLSSPSDPS